MTAEVDAQERVAMSLSRRLGNALNATADPDSQQVWDSALIDAVDAARSFGTPLASIVAGLHTDWNADQYRPDHVPELGERIFVDLDPEEALRQRRDYVDRWWDHPDMPMRDHDVLGPLGKEGAAAHLAEADVHEFGGGSPHLIEVTEAVHDWLQRKRGERS